MAHSEAGYLHVQNILSGNNAQLLAVWEHSADAMSLSDPQGIVLAANPAYYELYGYSAEEVIGHSFSIIFPPEAQESAVEQYKEIFNMEGIPSTYESPVSRVDGTIRIVESRIGYIYHDGKRTAMLSIIRDITERVQLEEQRDELLNSERQA